MARHRMLVVSCLILAVTSGCLGPFSGSGTCGFDPVTPIAHPDVPEEFTNESAQAFAVAYERARYFQREAGNHANASIRVVVDRTTRTDTGWTVTVGGGVAITGCRDGDRFHGDGQVDAQYFLNASGVYRAAGSESPTYARENGTRVARS